MNKQGQSIFTVGFILTVGILTWLFMATTLNTWGHEAALLANNGFEAFLWDNLNLWVLLGILAFAVIGAYVTTGGQ